MEKQRITHALRAQLIGIGIAHLKQARDLFTQCACTKPAARVRAALRSAEGAKRNADRFASQESQA